MKADLVLHGGEVFDPESRTRYYADVAIKDGRIQAIAPRLPQIETKTQVNVAGCLVSPGLVDMHSHVFVGQDVAVDPNVIGPAHGTTTFVDTGSTGGHLFDAFRQGTIERAIPRILAFLNIASIGTTSTQLAGELEHISYANEDVCVTCAAKYPGLIVGVKVRASGDVVGSHGIEPVRRARRAADRLGLPLMVHIAMPPPDIDVILSHLRNGDIVTHCLTGYANRLAAHGRVISAAAQARERGVIFDVGHGMGSFDVNVASTMLAAEFVPDTISTDIHSFALDAECDFPTLLSKFLALGLSVEDVITRATLMPARVLGLDHEGVGTLRVGGPADLAVFEIVEGSFAFRDTFGHTFSGSRRLNVKLTVQSGEVVYNALTNERKVGAQWMMRRTPLRSETRLKKQA